MLSLEKIPKILHGKEGTTDYFYTHTKPSLLLVSGLHGDETGVVTLISDYLVENLDLLPPFIYVPLASPSAAILHTRHNSDGIDLNRSFLDIKPSLETRQLKQIVTKFGPFETLLCFHEDKEIYSSYIYADTTKSQEKNTQLWRRMLKEQNIQLYSGVDDPKDKKLGFEAIDGCIRLNMKSLTYASMLECWVVYKEFVKISITIEVGGKLSQSNKRKVIKTSFESFLL